MKPKAKVLQPVHPNVGIEAEYRRKLLRLLDEMARSYAHWTKAAYRKNEPAIAQDASPAAEIDKVLKRLGVYWERRFKQAGPELAAFFARSARNRSDASMRAILKKAGISVEFKMTKVMKDVLDATTAENVGLIKSIPQQFHTQVQGMVMRSVQAGRDVGSLTKELQERYGVTRRRAALIARDQNNKATASMTRVRQVEVGITEAIWLHSHGGREPRKTHLANTGKKYDPAVGWYDPDPKVKRRIWPGELINCFPGSTKIDFAHDVEKAFRHFYRGELTEIVTRSGKTLRSTPNHPVLTPDGWRPIGSLNEGDYLVEVSDQGGDTVKPKNDIYRAEPAISQVFEALAETRYLEIALGDEFHGDAIADGNIDIVLPARPLSVGRKPLDAESFKKFGLAVSDHAAFRQSSFVQFAIAAFDAAHGIMGRAGESLSLVGGGISHSLIHRLATIADAPADALDPSLDRFPFVSEGPRKREDAHSGLVERAQAVRIISVKRRAFAGHVFNLQTREGYYSAGGIICHNCRCVTKAIVKGFS